MKKLMVGLVGAAALGALGIEDASACGCFAPPDPSVPIVQAGERILFASRDGQVTAHIQIQYQGTAQEFGWLLPLPSVPTLELSTDELFNQLLAQTQPKYRLNTRFEGNCLFGGLGRGTGGPQNAAAAGDGGGSSPTDFSTDPPSPLVIQDSIGPYDFAVLRADSRDEMFKWLTDNRYFVPAGSEAASAPYIRPGAFFLALKLRSGGSAGDVQPVVVKYTSDLPMIPIVLTSVAAKPDMGIQVWMLGAGRAIPRNYYHTLINDALIDWTTGGQNYNDVIIKATHEAEGRHTFVTEYAGSSTLMQQQLDRPGRFGNIDALAAQPDAIRFVQYLNVNGYVYTSQLLAILGRYIPIPATLSKVGAAAVYQNIGAYVTQLGAIDYRPVEMAKEIDDRVVKPTRAASALFDQHPYLTRLYTTLSAEDMNRDPVFSYNRGLPEVPFLHEATRIYHCGFLGASSVANTPWTLRTASGWELSSSRDVPSDLPASLRIEILNEEGEPIVVTDNSDAISGALGGCSFAAAGRANTAALSAGLLLLGIALRRKRSTT